MHVEQGSAGNHLDPTPLTEQISQEDLVRAGVISGLHALLFRRIAPLANRVEALPDEDRWMLDACLAVRDHLNPENPFLMKSPSIAGRRVQEAIEYMRFLGFDKQDLTGKGIERASHESMETYYEMMGGRDSDPSAALAYIVHGIVVRAAGGVESEQVTPAHPKRHAAMLRFIDHLKSKYDRLPDFAIVEQYMPEAKEYISFAY